MKNNSDNSSNNNDNNHHVAPPHPNTTFIDNLISRTLGDKSPSSSSDPLSSSTTVATRTSYNTTIKPALTPDMLPNDFDVYSDKDIEEVRLKPDLQDTQQEPATITFLASASKSSSTISPSMLSTRKGYSKNPLHQINDNYYHYDFSNNKQRSNHTTRVSESQSLNHKPENNSMTLPDDRLNTSLSTHTKVTRKSATNTTKTAASSANVTIHIGRIQVQARITKPPSPHYQQSFPSSKNVTLLSSQQSNASFLSLRDYLKNRSEGKY